MNRGKKLFIYQYKPKSRSAFQLASYIRDQGGKALIIKSRNSNFKPTTDKTILNWGSKSDKIKDFERSCTVINPVSAVELCSNKLKFFKKMSESGVSHPEFTSDVQRAKQWIRDGSVVMSRTLSGHSGSGISFSDEKFKEAPMYVKYIPKKEEYRVHVFRGDVIDVQQKRLRKTDDHGNKVDPENINFRVRSYKNGFVFARDKIDPPEVVISVAKGAFSAIPDLDFGAFDIIFNQKHNQAYVLECNTAPGLEGSTVESYVKALLNI